MKTKTIVIIERGDLLTPSLLGNFKGFKDPKVELQSDTLDLTLELTKEGIEYGITAFSEETECDYEITPEAIEELEYELETIEDEYFEKSPRALRRKSLQARTKPRRTNV